MIGSHNTMTYLKASRWWARPFARFWRCQDETIENQIRYGAYLLDIRVRQDSRGRWRFCHGIVDLGDMWNYSLSELLKRYVIPKLRSWVNIRLVLERGPREDFFREVDYIEKFMPQVVRVSVKQPWRDIFNHEGSSKDCYFKPVVSTKPWWKQLPGIMSFLFNSPRNYSLENNSNEDLWDKDTYIFIDFI